MDQEIYKNTLCQEVLILDPTNLNSIEELENYTLKFMDIVKETVNSFSHTVKSTKNRPKLKVWNEGISGALKQLKLAYKLWTQQGKPRDLGILTPDFKNKGEKSEATNFRGITVLPVIEKILETVIKNRVSHYIQETQNCFQRGFAVDLSSVEEVSRDAKGRSESIDIIFLDAIAAFDVVNHDLLLRRVYHAGTTDKHWSVLQSIHDGAKSVVKWSDSVSQSFHIQQGVRQGGVLSTDLYKPHVNPLLRRLEESSYGCTIGEIRCNSSACADDITLNS
ncbi:uncharacterized protein LOC128549923 [Mercenaria mercenaria]|uniref:uncharacterized protein LOC128549923 n=1 Tax=Mercenaria mercenaria TaxID=6596 RepID=UPI00234EF0DD|nr:uncharacterized protein LOC128549923 [Mercenaria mercenaria]